MTRLRTYYLNIWVSVAAVFILLSLLPTHSSESHRADIVIPYILVTSPANNEVYPSGSIISFKAVATDRYGHDISETLQWDSSLDGLIGHQEYFAAILSNGAHIISVTAVDSIGNSETVQFNIQVGEDKHK